MTQVLKPGFQKTVLNVEQQAAKQVVTAFESMTMPPGHVGEHEICIRRDSPTGIKVNLHLFCRVGETNAHH